MRLLIFYLLFFALPISSAAEFSEIDELLEFFSYDQEEGHSAVRFHGLTEDTQEECRADANISSLLMGDPLMFMFSLRVNDKPDGTLFFYDPRETHENIQAMEVSKIERTENQDGLITLDIQGSYKGEIHRNIEGLDELITHHQITLTFDPNSRDLVEMTLQTTVDETITDLHTDFNYLNAQRTCQIKIPNESNAFIRFFKKIFKGRTSDDYDDTRISDKNRFENTRTLDDSTQGVQRRRSHSRNR